MNAKLLIDLNTASQINTNIQSETPESAMFY